MATLLRVRTQLLVDQQGRGVADLSPSVVGLKGIPARILMALPLDGNPPTPAFPEVALVDQFGLSVADPTDGSVVGEPALYVHRLLKAVPSQDERGL